MITINKMTEIIEQKLNEAAVEMPFEFKIHANEGEFKAFRAGGLGVVPKPLVNGVLLSLPSTVVPLQGIKSYIAQQTLTILAPVDEKKGINDIMNAILTFVEIQTGMCGYEVDEDGTQFAFVFAVNMPQVGVENFGGPVGRAVPVSLLVSWQFVAHGVISNNVKISVDGEQSVLMDGSVVRTRIAETNNKSNNQEMTSIIGQQGLAFRVVLPYTSNGVGAKLMSDAVLGELGTDYALTYDDGIIKTKSGENPTWRVIATEITGNMLAGRAVSVAATFTIANATSREV